MSTPAQLLARTDQLARDLLSNPDTTSRLDPYRSWRSMINQAAGTWRAAGRCSTRSSGPDPFRGVESMINDSGRPSVPLSGGTDDRVTALNVQLDQLSTLYRRMLDGAGATTVARTQRVQGSVLHSAYLITHATGLALQRELAATRAPGLVADIARARETVGIAEQVFDVHLHREQAATRAIDQLDTALTRWTTTAHRVLAAQPPEPKNNYIISDVQHGLVVHTAALLAKPGGHDQRDTDATSDARDRLLPLLQGSAGHWREVRHAWASLAAPTTGISRELADAAHLLNQALRDPELDHPGQARHLITAALGTAVHTARGLADGFGSERLQAPTEVVVSMTRDALGRLPNTNPYQVFMGMSRHEGRAPIALPEPLRVDLTRRAMRNVEAARTVRSAAHGLLGTSTHIPHDAHRVGRPGVQAAGRAPIGRPRELVAPSR